MPNPVNNNTHSPVVGANTETPPPKMPGKELSPDDFIKLFLAQMKHQNPMHPTDSNAILGQMAQINQISASKDMQKTMHELDSSIKKTLGTTQVFGATQLIGKKVQIPSEVSPMIPKEGVSGSVYVKEPSAKVTVTIKDTANREIKQLDLGPAASGGLMDFKWDGLIDGKEVNPDFYHISAMANINGKDVPIKTAGTFKVNSVGLDQRTGTVILNVDGLGGKSMGDVLKIL